MQRSISFFKNFFSSHLFILKIALLTAITIIFFEMINLFVIYSYLRLDYYLSFVAIVFLSVGFLIARRKSSQEKQVTAGPRTNNLFLLLTQTELLIIKLIAEGKTNKEIAAMHYVEISTVKTHINNIYAKLAVTNRKDARNMYHTYCGDIKTF